MLGVFFKNVRRVKPGVAAAHAEDGNAGQFAMKDRSGCRCGERDDQGLKVPARMTTEGAGLVTYERVELGT